MEIEILSENIHKDQKFQKLMIPCITNSLKAIFYQTTQDAAPSAKIAAIRTNKFELQSSLCYQTSIFPLVFPKYCHFSNNAKRFPHEEVL